MAKQTELKNLLQELEMTTRAHERVRAIPFQDDQQARLFRAADKAEKRIFSFFDKVSAELQDSAAAYKCVPEERNYLAQERDKAEKRVFSFFDKLNTEIEDSARAYKNLQGQRDYLAQERDEARNAAVKWQNAAQKARADLEELAQQVMAMTPSEPFNEARAQPGVGDPIEVLMAPDVWIERQFMGTFVDGRGVPMVLYVHEGEPDWVNVSQVRMKPKALQQLQMFANVYGHKDPSGRVGALYETKEAAERAGAGAVTLLAVGVPVTITVAK